MIRIAIVEDEEKEISVLKAGLTKFFSECGGEYSVREFRNGLAFIESYRGDCDVVLMDIEMPLLDGYKTAQKLYERNSDVSIIFVTNMSDFAVKGYDVDAVGFMVKPVRYMALKMNLTKAVARLKSKRNVNILAAARNGVQVIPSVDLVYVEVMGHNLIYHTKKETVTVRGSLKEVEEQLSGMDFVRCNSCYLVNLRYVLRVENDTATLINAKLPISRGKKKEFIDALMQFVGERGGSV